MQRIKLLRLAPLILLFVCSLILLVSCSPAEDAGGVEEGIAESSADEEQKLFEKKQKLLYLMELPYPLSSYTAESVEAYKQIKEEILAALHSIGSTTEADEYIRRLQDILASMKMVAGELPQVYIDTVGWIDDYYSDAEIKIMDTEGKEYT